MPIPPSSYAALAGATVLLNPSGSPVTVAKAEYRRALVENQSARCMAAYLYAGAGAGESTTDLAWDGQGLICENGNLLAESRRFSLEPQLICSEIDLERLSQERMRQTSFAQTVRHHRDALRQFRPIKFSMELARRGRMLPERRPERFPYVPSNPAKRDERCSEVYEIQVQGLATRLARDGHQARRNRRVGRPRLDPGAAGVRAGDGSARLSAREYPRLHDAGVCDLGAHAGAGAPPDAGHRMHRARTRHPARCASDAQGHRPSASRRRHGLRHRLRERAGGRAHQPSVPPRQPQRRVGGRHRRSERTRARMVHLRRRRPDVALQRQRQRPQDAHPASHPMGRRHGTARRRSERDAARNSGHADQPRAGARQPMATRDPRRIPRR